MNVGMIFVCAYFLGTVLSFAIFFRVLQLSVGLRSNARSCLRLPTADDMDESAEIDKVFRA